MKKPSRYLSVLLIASALAFSWGALPAPAFAASTIGGQFQLWGGFLHLLGGFFRIGVSTPVATSSTACPQGSGYPDDGCAGAQSTGSDQVSNFFTGYTGTNYGANRPPWNVAGVDYPVGYSGTLNDPSISGNLPPCATYASNVVTVNSAPCTISHLNFSMHNGHLS